MTRKKISSKMSLVPWEEMPYRGQSDLYGFLRWDEVCEASKAYYQVTFENDYIAETEDNFPDDLYVIYLAAKVAMRDNTFRFTTALANGQLTDSDCLVILDQLDWLLRE